MSSLDGIRNQIRGNVRFIINPRACIVGPEEHIDILVTNDGDRFIAIVTVNDESALQGEDALSVEKALQALLEASSELLDPYVKKLDNSHDQLPVSGGMVEEKFFGRVIRSI